MSAKPVAEMTRAELEQCVGAYALLSELSLERAARLDRDWDALTDAERRRQARAFMASIDPRPLDDVTLAGLRAMDKEARPTRRGSA